MYNRKYEQLSPDDQKMADQIIRFAYDLLDLWDATITAKFEPLHLGYFGDPILSANWRLMFRDEQGNAGGISLEISTRYLDDPGYADHMFYRVVTLYAQFIRENRR